jgi:hypothetical protein
MIVAVALTASAGVANEMEPGPFPTGPSFANSTVWLPSALDKNPEYDVVPEVQDRIVVVGSQVIASVGFAAPPGVTRIALATRAKSAPSVSLFMPSPLLFGGRCCRMGRTLPPAGTESQYESPTRSPEPTALDTCAMIAASQRGAKRETDVQAPAPLHLAEALTGSRPFDKSVADDGDEQVISVHDYEVGHSRFSDGFPAR